MKQIKEYGIVYTIGAAGYGVIEILWRGFTHWTMILTGGMCLLLCYILNKRYKKISFPIKCIMVSAVIVWLEFVVGCIVNIRFGLNVWSYANQPFNILGQVCLLFSGMWLILSMPMIWLCNRLERGFYKRS